MKRMKKTISILIAIMLVISVFTVIPMTTASADAPDTTTVYVGVDNSWDQGFVTDTARVHYWGGEVSSDATLTALNFIVTNSYEGKDFVMYKAEIPSDSIGFKFYNSNINGDTWYGDDGNLADANAAFVISKDQVVYTNYIPSEQSSESASEQSSEPASESSTGSGDPSGETEYYIVGSMTDWGINDNYKLTKNEAADAEEYYFNGLTLTTNDSFKVVKPGETYVYYPDGTDNNYGQNGEINHDGTYDVYFRPKGNGGDGWFYNVMWVAESNSEQPSEQPSEKPSESASEPQNEDVYIVAGTPAVTGFGTALFGTEWDKENMENKMDPDGNGGYSKSYDVTTSTGVLVELKVVKNPNKSDETWYGGANGKNVKFTATNGEFTVHWATWGVYVTGDNVTPYVEPTTTYYFAPAAGWRQGNERYAAYVFNDNSNEWINMKSVAGTKLYSVAVPDTYTTIIFCRMNGATAENKWENKWNQTVNLSLEGNAGKYFILNPDAPTFDNGEKQNGTWSSSFATLTGNTVSLKDEIAVNFYIYSSEDADELNGSFVWGNDNYAQWSEATLTKVDDPEKYGGANYVATCNVAARCMTDDITLTLNKGETELLKEKYRVVDYAEALAVNEAFQPLLCATLNYGAACQTYFNYRTEDLASKYIEDGWNQGEKVAPEVSDLENVFKDTFTGDEFVNGFGYKYVGASVSATSKLRIRLFFTKENETAAGETTVKVNGKDAEIYKDASTHGYWCVDIDGIAAKDLFKDQTVIFYNGNEAKEGVYKAEYYYNFALTQEDENFKNAMKALWLYSYYAREMLG